ncbi:MAG: ZIP family metal transporter [Bacillota bacterium]
MSSGVIVWLLVALAALANLAGGALITGRRGWSRSGLLKLTALSAGFLLAVALLDLLPEALEAGRHAALWVLLGFGLVYLFERMFTSHFHFGEETHNVRGVGTAAGAWAGLVIHTFFDGLAIVAAFVIDWRIGFLVFMGVILHKLADGVTMASVALACHRSPRVALAACATLVLATVAGGLSLPVVTAFMPQVVTAGPAAWSPAAVALALSAGAFIYVAATDLLPLVNEAALPLAPLLVASGAGAFYLLSHVLSLVGLGH